MTEPLDPEIHAAQDALGEELLRIHVDSYGKGAGRAYVHIVDDLVVCVLDDLELQPNEEFLIKAGHGAAVVEMRSRYEEAIETTFRAAVERATGRSVTSFLSATKLDPTFAVEIFRLAPKDDRRLQEPTDD